MKKCSKFSKSVDDDHEKLFLRPRAKRSSRSKTQRHLLLNIFKHQHILILFVSFISRPTNVFKSYFIDCYQLKLKSISVTNLPKIKFNRNQYIIITGKCFSSQTRTMDTKAKSIILYGPNSNSNPKLIFGMWI